MTSNPDEKLSILIVDDRPENLVALEAVLEDPHVDIIKATSGNAALGLLLEHNFALVLLDVQMPDMDGFETAQLMRSNKNAKHIPIIFVTAISKEDAHVFKGYDSGAVDYLFKPIDPVILRSKVDIFLELNRQKRQLEKTGQSLKQTVSELERANRQMIQQQKAVIEEERLKILLQMAGATAHELNQPLMGLLGAIELMQLVRDDPQKVLAHVQKIETAGLRISEIVKKIQSIRHYETRTYYKDSKIIDIDQDVHALSVEANDTDFKKIVESLSDQSHFKLSRARSISDAMHILKTMNFDLVLLDYFLPDGTGMDFIQRIHQSGIEVPLVVITGRGDEMIASQVIQAGAYDYLPKEKVNPAAMQRIVANALEKARLKLDIQATQAKMAEMSIKDELTGLFNRRFFSESLKREVSRAERYETPLTLCMLDLDHFKSVNDVHGHPAGDQVLSTMGRLLGESIRESDIACRYGGEEFAVILPSTTTINAKSMMDRFGKHLSEQVFEFSTGAIKITVSIGLAEISQSRSKTAAELIGMADKALLSAKSNGRNCRVDYGALL